MKTGVIVYVVGDESGSFTSDPEGAVRKLNIGADRVEVISNKSGHFDVYDAWWSLTVKGMQLILFMIAEFTEMGELKLTGRKLRLCG